MTNIFCGVCEPFHHVRDPLARAEYASYPTPECKGVLCQLNNLRRAAAEAGDLVQVALCDRARHGDEEAILECAAVLDDGYAQEE